MKNNVKTASNKNLNILKNGLEQIGLSSRVSNHTVLATSKTKLKAMLVAVACAVLAPSAIAVTTNWATLTQPSTFPLNSVGASSSFTYATGARGTVLDPVTNQTVGFTISGEISSLGSGNWFGSPGIGKYTSNVYTSPYVGTSYVNGSISTTPSKMFVQTGYTQPQYKAHTITFDRPVTNVLLGISSLGSQEGTFGVTLSELVTKHSSLQFSVPFTILSSNNGAPITVGSTTYDRLWYGEGVSGGTSTAPASGTTSTISASATPYLGDATNGYYLSGVEGSGIIQFLGTYTSISWTVTAPEIYSGVNIAMSSGPLPTPSTLPGTYSFPANVLPPTYSLQGTVSGLAGQSVVLLNNGTNSTTVSADGPFTFSMPLNDGSAYAVTVGTQPAGQTCSVTNGTGTATANVTNVSVTCVANSYTIGGTVTGLATGQTSTFLNNNGNSTTVSVDGSFTFSAPVNSGGSYAVTVGTQPNGQTCTVTNGSGTASANVTNVTVTCTTNPVAPIPTLSDWAMMFLASLMAMFAIRRMRHQ